MRIQPPPLDNANLAVLLWRAAHAVPYRPAVVEAGHSVSYAALAGRAAGAARLLAGLGVRPGERVAVLLERGADAAAAYFGALGAGGVPVLLHEALRPRQVRHALERSGARAVLTHPERFAHLLADLPEGARVADAALAPAGPPAAPLPRLPGDPAQIVFTSGSTGMPKGVTLSHGNLWAATTTVAAYLGLRRDDRVASLLPFGSVYGLNQLLGSVACGATLVVERSPLPGQILESLAREGATVLAAVPPLWLELLRATEHAWSLPPSLRLLQNAGGHLPGEAVGRLRRQLPGARLFLQYGMTEVLRSTFLAPEEVDRLPGSIGRPIPGAEVRVLREDLTPCEPDEVGELVHRGPTVALGYWDDPEATARVFRPDPLLPAGVPAAERVVFSGDLVRRDAEGFLHFVGRRDRMIKSLGYRVGPDEIVGILHASGEVADAAVTAVTAGTGTGAPEIVAHVVLRPGGSLERLRLFCRREMPRYMLPHRFLDHPDLPRLPGGKHDLAALARGETPTPAPAPA